MDIHNEITGLKQIVDSIPVGTGIFYVYPDEVIELVYLNDDYYQLIKSKRQERNKYAGKKVINALHPLDVPILKKALKQSIQESRLIALELRINTGNKQYEWFKIKGKLGEYKDNRYIYTCSFLEIDQLKQNQLEHLAKQKQEGQKAQIQKQIWKNLPGFVATYKINEAGVFMTYVSSGCKAITGFAAQEILYRNATDPFNDVYPDDYQKVQAHLIEEMKSGKSVSDTFRILTRDGSYHWISLNLTPIKDNSEIKYLGIFSDINKEKENALIQEQLVNFLPGGIVIYRIGKTIDTLYYSDGILAITGYDAKSYQKLIEHDPISKAVYESDQKELFQKVHQAAKTGAPLSMSYRLKHVNGDLIWVQMSAIKIRDEAQGSIYYAIVTKPTKESTMYQRIVNDSSVGVLIVEYDERKIILANKRCKEFWGIAESAKVEGKHLKEILGTSKLFFTDNELEQFSSTDYQKYHKVIQNNRFINVYAKIITWNGRKAYICYANDETEIINNHKYLQNLIDRVPGGIAIYEIIGQQVVLNYVNEAYPKLLHDSREGRKKYHGYNAIEAVHPNDVATIKAAIKELWQGRDMFDLKYRVKDADEKYVWVRNVGSVIERNSDKLTLYCSYSDFNEIMKAQEELRSNRAMLNASLKSAKVYAWKYNYLTQTITDSGTLGVAYGLPKQLENIPKRLINANFIHQDSIADFQKLFTKLCSLETETMDVLVQDVNQSTFIWERLIYTPVFDIDGNYQEHIGTSIDITEQKEKENKYQQQLQFKQLLTNNTLGIVHYNLTKNLVTSVTIKNSQARDSMLHATVDQAINNNLALITDSKERAKFANIDSCQKMLDYFNQGHNYLCIRHHFNDNSKWVESNFDFILNPYNNDIEVILVLRDVSEIVRAELIIDKLVTTDYEAIMAIDTQSGKPYPFTNNKIEELLRLQNDLGDYFAGVSQYLQKYCVDSDLEQVIKENELTYIKARLEEVPVYTSLYTLNSHDKITHYRSIYTYLEDNKYTILCAIQDVSETYCQEEQQKSQLAIALKEAKRANVAKTEFLSRMSHDIRTPMNAIIGMTQLAKDEAISKKTMGYLDNIMASSQFLLGLINDILDLSKIESGELVLNQEPYLLEEFSQSINTIIKPLMEERKIHFTCTINCTVRCLILDKLRFNQIFFNLLSNASKFTAKGGKVDFIAEDLPEKDGKSGVRFYIQDNGVGISESFLPHIFDPFSQETNRDVRGTGLGLPIVKSLVEAMEGTLQVTSKLNKGTTFVVDLYAFKSDAKVVSRQIKRDYNLLVGKRILLVEDNEMNILVAKQLLEKKACLVEVAKNGLAAVALFASRNKSYYDAILMDVRMPVMNGIEATKRIRILDSNIPIIAMTADAFVEEKKRTLAAGMNRHLSKPINPSVLFDALIELFTKTRKDNKDEPEADI